MTRSFSIRAALGAIVLLAGTVAPSVAHAAEPESPETNYAGKQIARHEGVRPGPAGGARAEQTLGHDVSSHQGDVDWTAVAATPAKFVYVKATEGTTYRNPNYNQQYTGATRIGLVRGAYHFALPDVSDGAAQANFFLDHGGGWSGDGRMLPGAMDMEYNPYGETCYGKSPSDMVAWIRDFSATYRARTGREPTIYTSTRWWKQCTGNSAEFGSHPLWLARYDTAIGELPAGWPTHTIWQFANKGILPGDQNYFNGDPGELRRLAG